VNNYTIGRVRGTSSTILRKRPGGVPWKKRGKPSRREGNLGNRPIVEGRDAISVVSRISRKGKWGKAKRKASKKPGKKKIRIQQKTNMKGIS